MNEKLLEKLKQADFMEKIINCDTKEKIKEVFEKENVKVSDEEIDEVIDEVSKIAEAVSKMDEKDMENISGGGCVSDMRDKLACGLHDVGDKIWESSSTKEKDVEDYSIGDKALNKVTDLLTSNSREVATGLMGSAALLGVLGAVAGGRVAYKKIKNWAINRQLRNERRRRLMMFGGRGIY